VIAPIFTESRFWCV